MQDNVEDAIQEVQDDADNKLDKSSVKNTYTESGTDTYGCDYVNGLKTYSTTEKRIGTWVDNKPIYRAVYSGNIANGATLFTNVDAIIDISGYGFLGDLSRKVILNGIAADIPSTLFSCFYGLNNTIEFYAKYGGNATTAYNSNIILEYTKTTD